MVTASSPSPSPLLDKGVLADRDVRAMPLRLTLNALIHDLLFAFIQAQRTPPEAAVFQVTGAGDETVNGYYAVNAGRPTHCGIPRWRKMQKDGCFSSAREQGRADMYYSTRRKGWCIFIKTGASWSVTYVAVGNTARPPTDGWAHAVRSDTGPCPRLKWLSKSVCW